MGGWLAEGEREMKQWVRERRERKKEKINIKFYKIRCLYCVRTLVSSYHNCYYYSSITFVKYFSPLLVV